MHSIPPHEGFVGQRHYSIPRPLLEGKKSHPLLHALLPTSVGWYPKARFHYRMRERGSEENILILCVDGSGWCEIEEQRLDIKQHEAIVIPKGVPHVYGASDETPWSIHWVHFIGQEADYYANLVGHDNHTVPVDANTIADLVGLFTEIGHAFVGGFVLQQLIFAAQMLHHLLGRLFFGNLAFSPTLRTSRFHSLELTLAFMKENINKTVTIDELAAHAGLSKRQFARIFKEQAGYPPMDFFIRLKMQHASSLLSLTSMSVQKISNEVGYEDPYYFSRIFKKVMGVSPRKYRTHLQE